MPLLHAIQSFINSQEGQKRIASAKEIVLQSDRSASLAEVEAAAGDLASTIAAYVPASLYAGGLNSVVNVNYDGNDSYSIRIQFTGDFFRPSLYAKSGGVNNIYSLFSKGYQIPAGKHTPFGDWHGVKTFALRKRGADPFVEHAVSDWDARYRGKFQIIAEEIDDAYTMSIS